MTDKQIEKLLEGCPLQEGDNLTVTDIGLNPDNDPDGTYHVILGDDNGNFYHLDV